MKKALLIPGLGGAADCWSDLFMGRLRSEFRVETTTLPEKGTTISHFASELLPGEPPDLLIGFSIGSAVVQEMLCSYPSCTNCAVLMAPPAGRDLTPPPDETRNFADGRGRWSASMLEMMFTPEWLAAHPDVSELFPRVKKSVPKEMLIVQSNAITVWDGCRERLRNVMSPVLIIAGVYDLITPVTHARSIHSVLPSSDITLMETGHGFPWQCPVETADRILEFAG